MTMEEDSVRQQIITRRMTARIIRSCVFDPSMAMKAEIRQCIQSKTTGMKTTTSKAHTALWARNKEEHPSEVKLQWEAASAVRSPEEGASL